MVVRRSDLRDLALLLALSFGLGITRLAASDLPWIADPPSAEQSACEAAGWEGPLVQRITVTEALALLGRSDVTFVDARAGATYIAGHIPGALSLPAADAANILEVQSVPIPGQHLVVTYCDGVACEQSEYLGLLLQDRAGCEQVTVLEGGWRAWVDAGAPIIAGPEPSEGTDG